MKGFGWCGCWAAALGGAAALRADEMVKVGEAGRVGMPALPPAVRRTVVVHSGSAAELQKSHSLFFEDLQALGHQLRFEAFDANVSLAENFSVPSAAGVDNVVYFAPSAVARPFGAGHIPTITQRFDGGVNLMVASGYHKTPPRGVGQPQLFAAGNAARHLVNVFGVDFDGAAGVAARLGCQAATLVVTDDVIAAPHMVSAVEGGIGYSGMGLYLREEDRQAAFPVLRAAPTAYTIAKQPRVAQTAASGSAIVLVAAVQGRNNARLVASGSLAMFSDDYFARFPANRKFARELVAWNFGHTGVLAWSDVEHHKVGEETPPYTYRIKDDVAFSIDLWELSNNGSEWRPFVADDVQLEYTMLDPHIRRTLTPPATPGSATHSTVLTTPDKPGIFKFVVEYRRYGYSNIHMETLAPQRNFKHNDYERFLLEALPYYASCIAVVVGLFVFELFFLYHRGEGPYPFYYSSPFSSAPASPGPDAVLSPSSEELAAASSADGGSRAGKQNLKRRAAAPKHTGGG